MRRYSRKEFISSAWKGSLALLPAWGLYSRAGSFNILGTPSPAQPWGDAPLTGASPVADYTPSYLDLHASGELKRRGEEMWSSMRHCELCPRECHENRLQGEKGECGSTDRVRIASSGAESGESVLISGSKGSGVIVMSNCSLRCVFCNNWQASHGGSGKNGDVEEMASIMLGLQEQGCHNINLVTPTHYLPHILLALDIAASGGLRLPLVYSTSGWEKTRILKKLDGVVDIYLSDFKFSDSKMAARYSDGADSYPEITKKAILEMNRQVGVAKPSPNGLIYRGLMLRHLVMPDDVSGTGEVIRWIAENLPRDTWFNLMSQYHPEYKASKYPEINRHLDLREYRKAVTLAREAGLSNLDIQGS